MTPCKHRTVEPRFEEILAAALVEEKSDIMLLEARSAIKAMRRIAVSRHGCHTRQLLLGGHHEFGIVALSCQVVIIPTTRSSSPLPCLCACLLDTSVGPLDPTRAQCIRCKVTSADTLR